MRSQFAGSNVTSMILIWIAAVTHTVRAGGQNGANECDCNTDLPYFKCHYLLNVMARARARVCVCDFTYSHFEHLTDTFLYRRSFFLLVYSLT